MNNLLKGQGLDVEVYEDFVQETLDLLDRTRVDMDRSDVNGMNLLASFNDESITNAVITHFRVGAPSCPFQIPNVLISLISYTAHCSCVDAEQPRRVPAVYHRLLGRPVL